LFDFLKTESFLPAMNYKRRAFEKEPISLSCLGLVYGITDKYRDNTLLPTTKNLQAIKLTRA